ncbi:hypothetical protein RvY_10082 [Ramazzottius varieornatus]|uniref:HORMA domain-containing protein n=1 Tax=Ramazzottius varieornatus TaxID=947166 RepID=A0A1D1VBJ6_RAMVA|nr:hypothetical protein RvY_10082 [Ramazzottius varieornatus]
MNLLQDSVGEFSVKATTSADLFVGCLENVIHYILMKRQVYPRDKFQDIQKSGMNMVLLSDTFPSEYITKMLRAARDYLDRGELDRVVLCIIGIASGEVMERWQFSVDRSEVPKESTENPEVVNQVYNETAQFIKQIGVSFMPPLDCYCSFKILLYVAKAASQPDENWENSHPHYVDEKMEASLDLRPVNVPHHKLQAVVVYKNTDMSFVSFASSQSQSYASASSN